MLGDIEICNSKIKKIRLSKKTVVGKTKSEQHRIFSKSDQNKLRQIALKKEGR